MAGLINSKVLMRDLKAVAGSLNYSDSIELRDAALRDIGVVLDVHSGHEAYELNYQVSNDRSSWYYPAGASAVMTGTGNQGSRAATFTAGMFRYVRFALDVEGSSETSSSQSSD